MNIEYKNDIILAHTQLYVLTTVDINQKLSIYDDKLFIDETNQYIQPLWRFCLNQNRHSIYLFLERVLGKYINDIVAFKRYNFVTGFEIETRRTLTKDIIAFLNDSILFSSRIYDILLLLFSKNRVFFSFFHMPWTCVYLSHV